MSAYAAPVAFFAFNRPEHTKHTLCALAKNSKAAKTTLYAFIDGPRQHDEADKVEQVREIVSSTRGFADVRVQAAESNLGLFRSITQGVQAVLDTNESVIVVEDDIETAPCFLTYMNDALQRYRDVPEVGCIHGYAPPLEGLPDYFFLRGADCWGWATWPDRWALFRNDPIQLLRQLREHHAMWDFMRAQGAPSLLHLLKRVRGRNQSWAALWHASLFLAKRWTLNPGMSFVVNTGNDGSGTHSIETGLYTGQYTNSYLKPLPAEVSRDMNVEMAVSHFYDRAAAGRYPIPSSLLRLYAFSRAWLVAKGRTDNRR